MNFLIHITKLEFMSFLEMRLYPSLLLNAVFILIAGYPFKRQFEKFEESNDEMNE